MPSSFILEDLCFPEQLAFLNDTSRFVTASCSRRSGKTIGCELDMTRTAATIKGIVVLYITLTRGTAKRIMWKELLETNRIHGFGAKPNIAELSLTFPNGSVIYLSGCSTKAEIERFRGMPIKLVYIDEAQSFRTFLQELVDEVLAPALMDYAGSLKLIGTPAPLKRGYFWDTMQSEIYSHHKWNFFDNPHIATKSGMTHQELLDAELKRRGVLITDPSIRREWFGEWIDDTNALVCRYSHLRNDFDLTPAIMTEYVIGIDLGFNDADAIAVIGWNVFDKKCYLVEELVTPKQGITPLMDQISLLNEKYKPLRIVMDEGGLGKKIGEELRKRYQLPIQAAEKSRKQEYIALMNDAFLTKSLFVKKESLFAKESVLIEWDFDKSTADRKVIKHDPHSDIFDAVLYAYRESIHWLSEPIKPKMNAKTQWAQIAEKELYEAMEKEEERKEQEDKELTYWNIVDGSDPFKTDHENAVSYFVNNRKK